MNSQEQEEIRLAVTYVANNEMEKAWEEIKKHEAVTLTIDLFFIGLVFVRKAQKEKEHFIIRY